MSTANALINPLLDRQTSCARVTVPLAALVAVEHLGRVGAVHAALVGGEGGARGEDHVARGA